MHLIVLAPAVTRRDSYRDSEQHMANIMVTERCNLSCPYCFADEFVNRKATEISIGNFQKALEFVLASGSYGRFVGLIGGEPTLHSKFAELLAIVNRIDQLKEVLIFTNGIKIDETFDLTADQKFTFLINLNSPEVIGDKNYDRITKNIDDLVVKYDKKHSITLGLNLYKLDMDYSFFVDTLRKYRFRTARLSVTIPGSPDEAGGLDRLSAFKDLAYRLYVGLLYRGINVVFDCNKMPRCLWTDLEIRKISLFQANTDNERLGFNLTASKCNPVIDILPDLTAIRCFGLSEWTKVRIDDFGSLDELYDHYRISFDAKLAEIPATGACLNCDMFSDHSCYGGCLLSKLGSS